MMNSTAITIIISVFISVVAWDVVPTLLLSQIQPIASTIATVAGVLLGFVMASMTLLASASNNVLIRNTQQTGYLPQLVSKLSKAMFFLLISCITFIVALFISEEIKLFSGSVKLLSIVVEIGVFLFSFSICKFYEVWKEFSSFTMNM